MRLLAVPPEEPATTVLLLTSARFHRFEDFMKRAVPPAQALAGTLSFAAPIQIVPFHPKATYSEAEDDAADVSTRSPLPMLHLLRDSDVESAESGWAKQHPAEEPLSIQERNGAFLRGLGWERANALYRPPWLE